MFNYLYIPYPPLEYPYLGDWVDNSNVTPLANTIDDLAAQMSQVDMVPCTPQKYETSQILHCFMLHICIYVYIYTFMYIIYIYIFMYIIYIHIFMYIIYIYLCTLYIYILYTHIYIFLYIIYIYYTYVYIYIYMSPSISP